MVKHNDQEALKKLQEELFPGREEDCALGLRIGFCGTCGEVDFMDPPGGPFTQLEYECGNPEECPYKEDKDV